MSENEQTVSVPTPKCMLCGQRSEVSLTMEEVAALMARKLIQDALPNRDADFRELVLTGTHPACWDKMMTDDEEDEPPVET